MISSVASITSSSSATVRVEKATSEFLIGPDWTLNIDICDTVNSNKMLAKDVVKAVKKRLQHKNPKVQLLALTLLETMVKNCGDYVHFQIAERNILQEMVKIVRKKTDMQVRDKILTLVGSWHDAFGGPGGRYPQYYMAYEDLRRSGIQFPQHSPDAVPIFTPPVTHPIPRHPQPGYGMPSSSSTRLDEAMASEDNLSLSSMESMRNVLALLTDMLQAVDPNDRMAIKGEVIVDLVEQCHANQRKLVQSLATIGDEELLGQGLELNDSLQSVLAKYDAISSGSPLPPEVKSITNGVSERHDPSLKSTQVSKPSTASNDTSSAPVFPVHRTVLEEEDEEEDDFAQLARRHSKTPTDVSGNIRVGKSDATHSEAPSSPSVSNALVPIDMPALAQTKDQDIIDLLSITLSTATTTEQTSHAPTQSPSIGSGFTSSSEAYPGKLDMPFNNYIAPWALPQQQPQTQPQPQPQPTYKPSSASQPQHVSPSQPQPVQSQPQGRPQPELQLQHRTQYQHSAQLALHPRPQIPQYPSSYPPPPWAATPGYFGHQTSVSRPLYTYPTSRPTFSMNPVPLRQESTHGETRVNSSPRSAAVNTGQKPFIPSYRLFEDLDVFGNAERKFKATSNASPSLLESSSRNMVGGRK